MDKKHQEFIERGKDPRHHLLTCRPVYRIFDDPWTKEPPRLPDAWQELTGKETSDRGNIRIRMEDFIRLERNILGMQSTINFLSWMISTSFLELQAEGFVPKDKAQFKRLNKSLSISLAEVMKYAQSTGAFLVHSRRLHYAYHLPKAVPREKKKDLMAASIGSPHLFDKTLLSKLAVDLNIKSAAAATNVLATAFTTPKTPPPKRKFQESTSGPKNPSTSVEANNSTFKRPRITPPLQDSGRKGKGGPFKRGRGGRGRGTPPNQPPFPQ